MDRMPVPPHVPPYQQVSGEMSLRYEDLCQDGRLVVEAMPAAIGNVFWRQAMQPSGLGEALHNDGVMPILTRLVTAAGEGPLSIGPPLQGTARYGLATLRNTAGDIERLVLDVWIDIEGVFGITHGPPPERAGERLVAGRVFAEHTFTRVFAAPGERKVRRLPSPLPSVPPHERPYQPPDDLLVLPEGAEPIDASLCAESLPMVFGLDHTDANQHVNSLVYPRLFREAALRRLAAHGEAAACLTVLQETSFRKPCFAGDTMRIAVQLFRHDGRFGAVCCLLPDAADLSRAARAHAFGHVLF
jgi:acyl-CoA thioesterase FadM